MKIGFAQKDITPAIGKQMPGGAHVLTATKPPRGKLLATAAAFEENGEAVLLVSIDMLHMSDAFAADVRARIAAATGIPCERVMLCATHSHTAGAMGHSIWDCPADHEVAALTANGAAEAAREAFETRLMELLDENGIDIIILAGFMTILTERFTAHYPKRILNVHPSLIPSFCGEGFYGLRVHEEALKYGVKVTGATVHFVNEIPDGGEIIAQKAVYIEDGDTPEILQRRVMEQAEWILLPQAAEKVCAAL